MTHHKGFAALTALLIALGVIVLGGIAYVVMHPQAMPGDVQTEPGDHQEEGHAASDGVSSDTKTTITWRLTNAAEVNGIPQTSVTAVVNGTAYAVGTFSGSCNEIGANGGIDSKGLLAGELSAVQCWFAGSGDEIGVFAHEDGGYQIMAGELSEGADGAGMFRGNFSIKKDIQP